MVYPPQTKVTWNLQEGFDITANGPREVTPAFIRNNHEYVIEVTPYKENPIPSKVSIRFQFPYDVEYSTMRPGNVAADFSPIPSVRLNVKGPYKLFGERKHRDYILTIPNMPPHGGGKVTIFVILNSNPQIGVICAGPTCGKNKPPALIPLPPQGPMSDYIYVLTTFTMGGHTGTTNTYAPFSEDSNRFVSLGNFVKPPDGLILRSEP